AVSGKQRIPIRAPDDLDYVPAGSAEGAFELIDDLSIPTHRTIEALQVTVHDEDQVVELLSCCDGKCAKRLRLVGLAVAEESPNFARCFLDQLAIFQIAHEARLVNRIDRPNSHRDRRETPKVRHQPWVRI